MKSRRLVHTLTLGTFCAVPLALLSRRDGRVFLYFGNGGANIGVACRVSRAIGVQDLCLKFTGGSGFLLNLDWWRFEPGVLSAQWQERPADPEGLAAPSLPQ